MLTEKYRKYQTITGSLLFLLILFYVLLHFIRPMEGPCPHNAYCGVFVHCYQGFKYDPINNECVLSQDLYDEIETVCTGRIIKAREEWGQQECDGVEEVIPRIYLGELL